MAINYRDMLNARSLSISDKQLISEAYREKFNKTLNVNTKCRSCYNDALLELLNASKKGYQLRSGVVVPFDGKIYTKHSETLPAGLVELYKDKIIKL